MSFRIELLKQEIEKLAAHVQAMYEIDGLSWQAFNVLQGFREEDWYSLKEVVHTWSLTELEVLALTMLGYDHHEGLCIEHNFIFYLFHFIDNGDAENILSCSEEFFDDDFLTPELIHKIREKLKKLLVAKTIDERTYHYWKNKVDAFEKNMSNG